MYNGLSPALSGSCIPSRSGLFNRLVRTSPGSDDFPLTRPFEFLPQSCDPLTLSLLYRRRVEIIRQAPRHFLARIGFHFDVSFGAHGGTYRPEVDAPEWVVSDDTNTRT